MSTNFGKIQSNVGVRVGDTSSSFASAVANYANQRYRDVLHRINWNAIVENYVLTATAGTQDCALPSNFGKELYVWDSVSLIDIPYLGMEKLEQEYQNTKNASGLVEYYSIYHTTDSPSAASASRSKRLRFWRTPTTATCFEIPYIMSPSDLSSDSDELIFECERAVELGATSDAFATKKQLNKAAYFEQLYEKEIQNLIWNQYNQPNQLVVMNVLPLSRDEGI